LIRGPSGFLPWLWSVFKGFVPPRFPPTSMHLPSIVFLPVIFSIAMDRFPPVMLVRFQLTFFVLGRHHRAINVLRQCLMALAFPPPSPSTHRDFFLSFDGDPGVQTLLKWGQIALPPSKPRATPPTTRSLFFFRAPAHPAFVSSFPRFPIFLFQIFSPWRFFTVFFPLPYGLVFFRVFFC